MAPSSKSGANCSMCGCSSCRWPVLLQKYWDAAYAAVQERELTLHGLSAAKHTALDMQATWTPTPAWR